MTNLMKPQNNLIEKLLVILIQIRIAKINNNHNKMINILRENHFYQQILTQKEKNKKKIIQIKTQNLIRQIIANKRKKVKV